MTHGNILIQTSQIPGLLLSFEVLNEVKKRCYVNLDKAGVEECTFKLSHFEKAKLIPGDIPESDACDCDTVDLAKVIISSVSCTDLALYTCLTLFSETSRMKEISPL
ncbi:hypothetical protein ACTXT7_013898 [Hymenolepis weldensis]